MGIGIIQSVAGRMEEYFWVMVTSRCRRSASDFQIVVGGVWLWRRRRRDGWIRHYFRTKEVLIILFIALHFSGRALRLLGPGKTAWIKETN